MSTTTVLDVQGMTCGHCVKAVTDEVAGIAGVQSVEVDLATGAVTVTAEVDPTREQMSAAVDEAGYVLA